MAKVVKVSVEQVVAKAARYGHVECNPLSWRYSERIWAKACFLAAKKGFLQKERVNAGRTVFTPTRALKEDRDAE